MSLPSLSHTNVQPWTAGQAGCGLSHSRCHLSIHQRSCMWVRHLQWLVMVQMHKRTDDGLISDIYLSKEVKEGPKGSAVGAHLKLGKPLEISFLGAKEGSEQYEDLDEILARFVEPYVAQLKQIKGHRCVMA